MTRFPDFFIIGAPKCGTTSLFSWLQQHPDTCLPVKEPNFLSRDLLDTSGEAGAAQNEEEWRARLSPAGSEGKLTGESTPKYLYSDNALSELSAKAESVRLIVLLRNPVDLAVAMHAQNVRQGREKELDFAKAWDRGPMQSGDLMTDYRFWGRPGERLKLYLQKFPSDRLLVLILEEEMKHDPAAAHTRAVSFLRLKHHSLDSYSAKNPRKSYRSPWLQGLSRRFRRGAMAALDAFGMRPSGGTGLMRLFDMLNGSKPAKAEIDPEMRQKIALELSADAHLVAQLMGRQSLPWPDFAWADDEAAVAGAEQHDEKGSSTK